MLAPKGSLEIHEEAWNAYPYCKTVLTNPDYMKENFRISIESLHLPDRGSTENDYKPDTDPKLFRSVKTGRGPLGKDWTKTASPVMCAYKLVRVEFKWWGLQGRMEKFIQSIYPRLFTKFHREVVCWIDKWYGLTMADIRALEEKAQKELDEELNPNLEAADDVIEELVRKSIYGRGCASITCTNDDKRQRLIVKFRTELESGFPPFVWEFRGRSHSNQEEFYKLLIEPLFLMTSHFERREKLLTDLLLKKDQEIKDYKFNGAQLLRRNLETEEFKPKDWFIVDLRSQGCIDATRDFIKCQKHPLNSENLTEFQSSLLAVSSYLAKFPEPPTPESSEPTSESVESKNDSKNEDTNKKNKLIVEKRVAKKDAAKAPAVKKKRPLRY